MLALALPDAGVAVLAVTAGGLAGVLVAAPMDAAARAAFVGTRELRALAIAAALAILATAWVARPLDELAAQPTVFGLAYHELRRRREVSALRLALIEHITLFPLGWFVDRHHPARGQAGLESVFGAKAFVQATWRHFLFGAALGRFAGE